jgi:hypothetical protein
VDVVEEETEKEVINIQVNAQVWKVYELTVPNDDYEVAYHRSFVLWERNKKEVKLINKRWVAVADAGDFLSFGWDYIKFAFKKKPEWVYKTVFSPTSPWSFKYTLESKNTDFIVTIAVWTTSVTKDIYREWISWKEVFKFQEQDLTIEEYTYKLFELAYFEVLSLPYDVRPIVFYEKFSDTWPWNFKFSLIELWYLKEKWQRFNFNWMSINWADLWNLMFGYLSHHGWFYDNALKRANDLETIKYRPYYGEELWRKRTYIDEANDIPFYKAWKTISIPSNDLYLEMLLAIKNWLDWQVDTAKLEEEWLKEICDKTYWKYIEWATKAANICLEKYYSDYYIIVDKPFSILKMVVVPKKDWENLIPIPIIKYD